MNIPVKTYSRPVCEAIEFPAAGMLCSSTMTDTVTIDDFTGEEDVQF